MKFNDLPNGVIPSFNSSPPVSSAKQGDFEGQTEGFKHQGSDKLEPCDAQDGLEVISRLEDIYLRLIHGGYTFSGNHPVSVYHYASLQFVRPVGYQLVDAMSHIESLAVAQSSYVWRHNERSLDFSHDIRCEINTFCIALTPFDKIACWPEGDILVCGLRDLMLCVTRQASAIATPLIPGSIKSK
jgi:hypothetical protein